MQQLFDASRTNQAICTSSAHKLRSLAASFWDTGNSTVGERLDLIAEQLFHAADVIGKAVNDNAYEQVRASEQASWNLLQGVIAGIGIGEGAAGE